jgi:hypothetical protein
MPEEIYKQKGVFESYQDKSYSSADTGLASSLWVISEATKAENEAATICLWETNESETSSCSTNVTCHDEDAFQLRLQ